MTEITPEIVAQHGLSSDEYARIVEILGRSPNITELGIFSVMWSEHCSYKSSKRWLKTLPTEAPWVICGPGENAGVVDIGDGQAIIFKMESHNHPSFIEPYQGAATGVGGILRDVFTMGARPIANLNSLRFGAPDHPKTRHLLAGVVAGIGGYGNCVGVPTVGGECGFDPGYDGNILVNAMTVGLADAERIFYSAAAGPGSPIIYVGSKTGRDGIHGATMASAEFSEETEEKRPTVQIGDPFTEKLLIEACLELMATDAIIAIQDMGAAGLTSSSFEMASKGGVGVELDLDRVPQREENMTAYEMMLSESQERMLMVLKPDREAAARAIFEKWELDFAVIGRITEGDHFVARHRGEVVIDVPVPPLVAASPEYDRPRAALPTSCTVPVPPASPTGTIDALERLIASPSLASKRWIWEQYDHMVMANTVQGPSGDAAVVRVNAQGKGVAMTCDCTPRYCFADPLEGGRQAVAEAWRNLNAVGARPLAITDCLNFGNPEKPDIMAQFADCVTGMGEACAALDMPVVSGNVSLYNETNGIAIPPTPTVGAIGVIDDIATMATIALKSSDDTLILVGQPEQAGWLGQSLYLRELHHECRGAPPAVDLGREKRNGEFVRALISKGLVRTCHDISDGGIAVAVSEMVISGRRGARLRNDAAGKGSEPDHAWLFGEDQGRYVIACTSAMAGRILTEAQENSVAAIIIGEVGGDELIIGPGSAISVSRLRDLHESWLPHYIAASS
ncbi:MAG: phosphoribosylformylglycinamidine synthase subunit PurL [Hyphomicrobiales bacterium]|nr:phosphoribosylformylglycinamidine synthase subunit PurL [Hyphomicrobiales bacterium]